MLVLNSHEVSKLFKMSEAVNIMKKAFMSYSSGKTRAPVRTGFELTGRGDVLFMPASVSSVEGETVGIKIVSVFPRNAERDIPVVPGQVLLVDSDTGEVQVIMNATELTKIRTGAMVGAATDVLARQDASVGAIFGAGGLAMAHLEAMLTVRPLKEVRIFDSVSEKIQTFIDNASRLADKFNAKLVGAWSGGAAVDGADIITTVTTSKVPVFNGTRVNVGTHVNGVGSFRPNMRELDEHLLNNSKVFVDSREAVLREAGDILIPESKGLYSRERIEGEIGEVLLNNRRGRTNQDDITVFKSVGFAVLDVTAAVAIYKKALEAGVGTNINI